MSRPLLCLDFDGVIHSYTTRWQGAHIISDAHVPGVGRYIIHALTSMDVAIYSSRSRSLRGRRAMKRYVRTIMEETIPVYQGEAIDAWAAIKGKVNLNSEAIYADVTGVDLVSDIVDVIQWPWFKPSAFITIDDRALTFNGKWDDPKYDPDVLKEFKSWNKKTRRRRTPN